MRSSQAPEGSHQSSEISNEWKFHSTRWGESSHFSFIIKIIRYGPMVQSMYNVWNRNFHSFYIFLLWNLPFGNIMIDTQPRTCRTDTEAVYVQSQSIQTWYTQVMWRTFTDCFYIKSIWWQVELVTTIDNCSLQITDIVSDFIDQWTHQLHLLESHLIKL